MLKLKWLMATTVSVSALAAIPADAAAWTKLGGLPGAQFQTIAVDPSNPANVFAGTYGGGTIFRSIDGGATFAPVTVAATLDGFGAIAVDPANSKIVFALGGNNEDIDLQGNNGGEKQSYLYESKDGGKSWTRPAKQPYGNKMRAGVGLVIDKAGTTIVTADNIAGISRSTDQGATWTTTLPNVTLRALITDPNDATTLWATTSLEDAVILKSTDFGKSWTKLRIPFLEKIGNPTITGIAVLPGSGQMMVSAHATSYLTTGGYFGGVLISMDGGKSWTDSSTGLPSIFDADRSIVVDPTSPKTVYLGRGSTEPASLYRSTDAGAHWHALDIGGGENIQSIAARPAGHGLAAAVLAGGEGLFGSVNHGTGWSRIGAGINQGVIIKLTEDHLGPGGVYASTGDGLFHSTNDGQSWVRISTWKGGSILQSFDVDPIGKTHDIFAATAAGFWRSTDAGKSWTAIPVPGSPAITNVQADPSKSGRIYAYNHSDAAFLSQKLMLYRTENAGSSWAKLALGATEFAAYPDSLMFDPTKPGTLYVADYLELLKSTNAGTSFTYKNPSSSYGVSQFAMEQASPGIIILGDLSRSADGGNSWSNATNPFNGGNYLTQLTSQPGSVSLYGAGGGDEGPLFHTRDGGLSWTAIDRSVLKSRIANLIATSTHLYIAADGVGGGTAYGMPVTK